GEQKDKPAARTQLPRRGKSLRRAAGQNGEGEGQPVEQRTEDDAVTANDQGGGSEETEQVVLGCLSAFDLFEFEFVRPVDDWTPQELIEKDNDGDHGSEAPEEGAGVSVAGGGLQIRAEAGQAEVTVAEDEHFAGHEEKPAAGYGHHGIRNESNGGERKIQLDETLPAAETVNAGDFAKLARDGLEGGVETESHVPDLPGEDEQDGTEFNAELAVRK